MMKKTACIFLFCFLVLHTGGLFSQNLQIDWQNCFGGSDQDNATDIINVNGGYLIIGWTESNDGDISFNYGGSDGWVIKIDSIGNLIWEKSYGGSKGDNFFRILPDNLGNYYILGASNSSDGDVSFDPYPNSWDYWILKIDTQGNIIWDKIIGGTDSDNMATGYTTSDKGVVAVGWTYSSDGDVSEDFFGYDVWAVKLSSEGEVEWDFTLGTDHTDYGQAIIQTTDGGYLVGCSSEMEGGGNLDCTSHGLADGVLVKLDSLRNIEWQHCYGGSEYEGITGLLEAEDGYIFLAYASLNNGDISGWHEGYNHLGYPNNDIWVVKVDFSSNIVWQKCFGGTQVEYTCEIIQLSDGSFMIFGNTDSHDGDVVGNHSGNAEDYDIWAIHISSEGELLGQQCFGGWGDDRIEFGMVKNSDTDFVIAGQTDFGPSYDVACAPHGGNWDKEYWVFEIKDTTVAVQESMQIAHLKVYPNPANTYVVFEHPFLSQGTIRIQNPYGQLVAELPAKDEKTVWDTRHMSPGMYFYTLQAIGIFQSGKLLICK
jgi:hypothetical protein